MREPVIFRKQNGEIVAVCPTMPWDNSSYVAYRADGDRLIRFAVGLTEYHDLRRAAPVLTIPLRKLLDLTRFEVRARITPLMRETFCRRLSDS